MNRFDRFTKALAVTNISEAIKTLLGGRVESNRCNIIECNSHFDCNANCYCAGVCIPLH